MMKDLGEMRVEILADGRKKVHFLNSKPFKPAKKKTKPADELPNNTATATATVKAKTVKAKTKTYSVLPSTTGMTMEARANLVRKFWILVREKREATPEMTSRAAQEEVSAEHSEMCDAIGLGTGTSVAVAKLSARQKKAGGNNPYMSEFLEVVEHLRESEDLGVSAAYGRARQLCPSLFTAGYAVRPNQRLAAALEHEENRHGSLRKAYEIVTVTLPIESASCITLRR